MPRPITSKISFSPKINTLPFPAPVARLTHLRKQIEIAMQNPSATAGAAATHTKPIPSQNAAKHNCTSKTLILPEENQSDFDRLLAGLVAEYQPETEMQAVRVNEAARAIWELRRIQREFDKCQTRLYGEQPDMCQWNPQQQAQYDRMCRYRTRAERTYNRALQSVECLRTMRLRAEQRAFWENVQMVKLDLSEARLQLALQRFEQKEQTAASPKQNPQAKPAKAQPNEWNQNEPTAQEAYAQADAVDARHARLHDELNELNPSAAACAVAALAQQHEWD